MKKHPAGERVSKQKRLSTCIVMMVLLITVWTRTFSQEGLPAKVFKIVLEDGSELIGTILSEDQTSLKFRTLSGVDMVILKAKIKSIEPMEVMGGKVFRTDPNQTRLFLAPTARPLAAGQGYFSAYEIFFPYFAFGVTDFLALGGGMSLFPFVSGQVYYFAPKLAITIKKDFSLGAGVLYSNSTSASESGIGILYGLGTYGKKSASVTIGLGWGYSGEGIANSPILMVGGELQVSNSLKLLTENWIPFGSDMKFLSFGVRFFGKNLAADFGLMLPTGTGAEGFPFIPWLGFAYNFGRGKS
jgi:hypothetical protein